MIQLASLPLCRVSAVCFRQTDYDSPFWARANSIAGRWNAAGTAPTQYWATSPAAAWAERIRQEALTTEAEVAELRTTIWAARVDEQNLLDLTSKKPLPRTLRLTTAAITGPDHERCRTAAAELQEAGVRGIRAPSAAIDGGVAITLLGPRIDIAWEEEPMLAGEIPVTRVAYGCPPRGLLRRVVKR